MTIAKGLRLGRTGFETRCECGAHWFHHFAREAASIARSHLKHCKQAVPLSRNQLEATRAF